MHALLNLSKQLIRLNADILLKDARRERYNTLNALEKSGSIDKNGVSNDTPPESAESTEDKVADNDIEKYFRKLVVKTSTLDYLIICNDDVLYCIRGTCGVSLSSRRLQSKGLLTVPRDAFPRGSTPCI